MPPFRDLFCPAPVPNSNIGLADAYTHESAVAEERNNRINIRAAEKADIKLKKKLAKTVNKVLKKARSAARSGLYKLDYLVDDDIYDDLSKALEDENFWVGYYPRALSREYTTIEVCWGKSKEARLKEKR